MGRCGKGHETNLLYDQIMPNSLEELVGLLLQDKDDISRLHIGVTAARFPPKYNLRIVLVTLLDVHLKHLLLRCKTLSQQHNNQCDV
jgi:hypothetical protein